MTEFATINGYTLPVAIGTPPGDQPLIVGANDDAFSGAGRITRRTIKNEFKVKTPPMQPNVWNVVRAIVLGQGFHWSFDEHLWSDNGLGPNAGYSVTLSSTVKYGTKAAQVASGASLVYAIPIESTKQWTVMWWFYESAVWTHYGVSNASGTYKSKNGATFGGTIGNVSFSENAAGTVLTVTFQGKDIGGSNGAAIFDDVVALQVGTYSQAALNTLEGSKCSYGQAWPALPNVNLGGLVTQLWTGGGLAREVTCIGSVDSDNVIYGLGAVSNTNNHEMALTFRKAS